MKVIFAEGSLHHLKTMEMLTSPRVDDRIVVEDHFWIVKSVTHFPKVNGRNDNENMCPWDNDRDADVYVHLQDSDE